MATLLARISRASLSSAPRSRALGPYPSRPAASTPSRRWLSDGGGDFLSDDGSAETAAPGANVGTVKFYRRKKAYGFITADDESIGEIFVHGLAIDSADRRTSEKANPFFPFLLTGERVSFDVENGDSSAEGATKLKARLVRYEDGSEVPTTRATPNDERIEKGKRFIGHSVFRMMETEGEDNPDHVGRRVIELYEREMKAIKETSDDGNKVLKENEDISP